MILQSLVLLLLHWHLEISYFSNTHVKMFIFKKRLACGTFLKL